MEEINVILVIAAIIQLVTLVVFFVMASNVSAIKNELKKEFSSTDYIEQSNEEKYVGNKAKAKEWLLRAEYNLQKRFEKIKYISSPWEKEEREKIIIRQMEIVKNLLKELE
ncbi:MAG: hypothetical protein WCX48_05920 [Bacteroidales bacterium]